jgi:hypothetical protein
MKNSVIPRNAALHDFGCPEIPKGGAGKTTHAIISILLFSGQRICD